MNGASLNQLPQQHDLQPVPGSVSQHEIPLPPVVTPEATGSSVEQQPAEPSTERHLGSVGVQQAVGNYVPGVGNVIGDQPVSERRFRGIAAAEKSPTRHDIFDYKTREPSEKEKELIGKHLSGEASVEPAVEAAPVSPEPAGVVPAAAEPKPYAFADSRPSAATGPRSLDELLAKASASGIEVDTAAPSVRSSGRPAAVQPSPRAAAAAPQSPAEAVVPAPGIPEAAKPDDWQPGDLGPGDLARRREALKQASIAQSEAAKARIRAATPRSYIPGS